MGAKHPNIVPLLGYVVCQDRIFPGLVAQWYENGDLWTYLTKGKGKVARSRERLGYVSGVFHSVNPTSTEYGRYPPPQVRDVANALVFCKQPFCTT